ncbi:MAG: hypothetical protein M3O99_02140, partial [Chloroflexota bacterium]|nr:hypothetical protein [Chloroflexota bacterium]
MDKHLHGSFAAAHQWGDLVAREVGEVPKPQRLRTVRGEPLGHREDTRELDPLQREVVGPDWIGELDGGIQREVRSFA